MKTLSLGIMIDVQSLTNSDSGLENILLHDLLILGGTCVVSGVCDRSTYLAHVEISCFALMKFASNF